jgi:dTDP-4-amino-4,6-dideoxygalactose transaminase
MFSILDKNMKVPFHRAYITEEDIKAVSETMRNGWVTMGPQTQEFENKFKEKVCASYAVAVSSCTAAMHLALKVIGIAEGDEIIIPAMTFTATGEVVSYFDAKPVIVDVDRETHNILPKEIERAITKKTRVIMPVHFGGQPADMNEILEISKKYNLKVIEDAAHCFPSYYQNRVIGNLGDITTFSFYATKTITMGEGGIATTENKQYSELMKILRLHGINKDAWKRYSLEGNWYYEVIEAGYKYNMTDIQASLGLSQLQKAFEMWEKRKRIAEIYNDEFSSINQIITPKVLSDRKTSWHLYVIKIDLASLTIDRDYFIQELNNRGIGTSVHFIPLYRHPYYRKTSPVPYKQVNNSEWLYKRIISLPIYPGMNDVEIEYVVNNVKNIAQKYSR